MNRTVVSFGLFALFFIFGFYLYHEGATKPLERSLVGAFKKVSEVAANSSGSGEKLPAKAASKTLQDVVEAFREEKQGSSPAFKEDRPFVGDDLRFLKGRELYVLLKNEKFTSNFSYEKFVQIKKRFYDPLPAEDKSHVSPREQELAQRLALLRALSEVPAKQFKSTEGAEVTDFYWTLLNDSQKSWVFQRQAYINLRRHFLVTRENQLHELLKKVRPEVIALAQLNEKDIFEAYLGYE